MLIEMRLIGYKLRLSEKRRGGSSLPGWKKDGISAAGRGLTSV
jgi:hypothetical protein